MDEPTAGLDVQARNDVLDILREYMAEDENRSIIITSHISSDIENLCDDVYLINDGRIILHEDTDTIVEQYGIVKVKEEQYEKLDKNYILKTKKECYGYACFVSSKAFYKENYPDITVENGGIDELILMMDIMIFSFCLNVWLGLLLLGIANIALPDFLSVCKAKGGKFC